MTPTQDQARAARIERLIGPGFLQHWADGATKAWPQELIDLVRALLTDHTTRGETIAALTFERDNLASEVGEWKHNANEAEQTIERLQADNDIVHSELRAAKAEITARMEEIARHVSMLAACYRAAGADTDGDEEWRYAGQALEAVQELRKDYDAACDEVVTLSAKLVESEAREGALMDAITSTDFECDLARAICMRCSEPDSLASEIVEMIKAALILKGRS